MPYLKSAALLFAAATAAPASAQMVRAQDPQSVVRAMQAKGFVAELGTDRLGDPMIRSASSGTNFQVFFYNCADHKECATIQFHVGFDLKENPSLETINEWNRIQRFGRAFLDKERDPVLQMDVDLDDGGVSQELFADNLEFWTSVLARFEKHIGYRN